MFPLALLTKFGTLLVGPLTQAVTGLNLVTIFTGVTGNVEKHWKAYAIAGLIATNVTAVTYGFHEHKALKTEKAAHAADVKSFKDATAAAAAKAAALANQAKQRNQEKANAADADYSGLYAKYRSNLVRYKAHQSRTRRTYHSQPDAAQGTDGPSTSTVLPTGPIVISDTDADICAENTARLQAAHTWAESVTNGN